MSVVRMVSKAAVLPLGVPVRRRPGDVVVLAYHRIGAGDREVDLPLDLFERQLDVLQEHDAIVPLDDALAGRPGVVLTFDDGTRDFSDHVVPLALGRGVPVHLYLATSFVEGHGGPMDGASLTWQGLREAVASNLVTVGSHTHSHRNLARAGRDDAGSEIVRAKGLIEDHLGVACPHFAYPWGVASADAQDVVATHHASAALDGWHTNRAGSIDPLHLGRTPVLRSDGVIFFRAKTKGLLDREALLYRALGRGPWGKT